MTTSLDYLYLLTPEGMKAKLRLTRAYLDRKEAEYEALKREIKTMRAYLARLEGDEQPMGPWPLHYTDKGR